MPVLEREEYIEQAYFFHAFRERLVDGLPSQEILARIGEELLSTTKLPLAVSFLHVEMKGTGPDGAGHGADQPLLHAVPGPCRRPGRERHQPVRHGAGPLDPGARGQVQGRGPVAAGPVRLSVRGAVAQPAGLHQGPGRHGRRPVLHRGLARLHPDAPHPAGRRRLRRPDLRPLRAVRQASASGSTPTSSPSSRSSSARRKGRSRGPTGAATRCTSSRPSSASSATPKSPGPAGPTSSRPASCSSSKRSPSSKTASRSPRATSSRTSISPRSWSSPKTPPASRRDGGRRA